MFIGTRVTRPIEQTRPEEAELRAPIRREARPELSVPRLLGRLLVVAVGSGSPSPGGCS